jgi:hypothetical protein
MLITDEQIRAACKVYDLDPVGRVPVVYNVDLAFDEDGDEDWENDDCHSLAYSVVSGNTYPEAGPRGFAAGHLSPGWKFLRDLCDRVAGNDIGTEWFEAMDYDQAREHLQDEADRLVAMMETPGHVLVCVADLGVNEGTEDAKAHLGNTDTGGPRRALLDLSEQLLGYAGYLVLREVFAPQIDSTLEN